MTKVLKPFLFISLAITLALSTACHHSQEYVFMHNEANISKISIVTVSINNGELYQTEENDVLDIKMFLNDFKKLDCYTWFGDPLGIEQERSDIIKIVYSNGDYELISCSGQAQYSFEKGFNNYTGFSVFDKDQYKQLISKYDI